MGVPTPPYAEPRGWCGMVVANTMCPRCARARWSTSRVPRRPDLGTVRPASTALPRRPERERKDQNNERPRHGPRREAPRPPALRGTARGTRRGAVRRRRACPLVDLLPPFLPRHRPTGAAPPHDSPATLRDGTPSEAPAGPRCCRPKPGVGARTTGVTQCTNTRIRSFQHRGCWSGNGEPETTAFSFTEGYPDPARWQVPQPYERLLPPLAPPPLPSRGLSWPRSSGARRPRRRSPRCRRAPTPRPPQARAAR